MMHQYQLRHYCDAIMDTVASQITSLTIVCTTVYSDADQSKHQSSASLAFVWGIHRGPVNSPHKWPVTRKMFPFDDVIMINSGTTVTICGSIYRCCLSSTAIPIIFLYSNGCWPSLGYTAIWLHGVIQYIPRNMHTVFALLCFVVVIHWLIFPYPPGLLRWHCGNLTIAPVPAKQPWWIWINTSCEIIMNNYITTTTQSTTKPCADLLGYTVSGISDEHHPAPSYISTHLHDFVSVLQGCIYDNCFTLDELILVKEIFNELNIIVWNFCVTLVCRQTLLGCWGMHT